MLKPKILILTGDAAESLEVLYPYQRLIEGRRLRGPHCRTRQKEAALRGA